MAKSRMDPPISTPQEVLSLATTELQKLLPSTWAIERIPTTASDYGGGQVVPASIMLRTTTGPAASWLGNCRVEVRKLQEEIGRAQDQARAGGMRPILVARFLSQSQIDTLRDRGVDYLDATGNVRLQAEDPALLINCTGATADPWKQSVGRPKANLEGPPRARVVRALIDFNPPFLFTGLMRLAKASAQPTEGVVSYLGSLGTLTDTKEPRRRTIDNVDWKRLLTEWSQAYSFAGNNRAQVLVQPRGLDQVLDDLRACDDVPYVVTGTMAAREWRGSSLAPPASIMIYTQNPSELAKRLRLREPSIGGNVLLASTDYDIVYQRSRQSGGVNFAAASQAAVDSLSGAGREPQDGEDFIDWMAGNEYIWRE